MKKTDINFDIDAYNWLNGSELGYDIWNNKYRYNNESFEEWLDRVSNKNNNIKRLIREKKFLFGGRILANRGLKNVSITLSNCYVIKKPNDNLESIFECCSKLARTYSYGGGCGIDISNLRPNGAITHNAAKKSSGPVSFMDLFSQVTGTISQSGRRGALMISMDINHPDIEEFIDCKTDLSKVNYANISVRISDKFMKCVENDEDYILHWPCNSEIKYIPMEYDNLEEVDGVYYKKVKAKRLFSKLAKNNWAYAEPGILYWDRISNYNMLDNNEDFEYGGVNPCVSGDTVILTDNGYQRIDSLVGKKVKVWNGYEWSEVEPRVTGHNQEMLLVTMSNGTKINCTKYHKFVLKDGSRVEAKDLKIGDKLVKCEFPVIGNIASQDFGDDKTPYTMGFFAGDGYVKRDDEPIIYLYGDKKKCLPYIIDGVIREDKKEDRIAITLTKHRDLLKDKFYVPGVNMCVKDRLNWLAGLIDSNGCKNDKGGSITISSIREDFLKNVQYMLNTLGVSSSVGIMRKYDKRLMPKNDGTGEYAMYDCKESYRLLIAASQVQELIKIGLNLHRVDVNPNPNRSSEKYIKIARIEENGVCDTVYCFNEPKNHTGIFNGCITAQCAEEPLPAGGSCLLGSLNLSEYVNNPFETNASIDFEKLSNDVSLAVEALNEVLMEGMPLHPLSEQRESVNTWRQIGLGTMGLADMLIKLGIVYGSKESLDIIDKIYNLIARTSVDESCEIGTKQGSYLNFDEKLFDSTFIKNIFKNDEHGLNLLKKKRHMANSQLLTCAPTGSIATMLGISTGVEPIYAMFYNRTTKSLNEKDTVYKVYTPIAQKYLENHDNLPEYFVESAQINPMDRIKVQAKLQENTDAAISSTINLPKETTVEEIYNIYMEAWKQGLKGVTVFRSGCSRQAILSTENEVKKTTEFNKRPKTLDGEIFPVKVKGEQFAVIIGYMEGKPYEIFAMRPTGNISQEKGQITKKAKRHYSFKSENILIDNILETNINAEENTATLYISQLLRHNVPIKYIIKTAKKAHPSIISFTQAICRILGKFLEEEVTEEKCPMCGGKMIKEGGCMRCENGDYSKCGD